jgi:RimJ/RimL family protein N-acetyltransferase
VQVPVLETERLKLRGHRLEDFIHSAAMWADPRVTQHIGGKPLTEEESWTRFLRYVNHWSLLGFGYWVVEEKATGNSLGEVGFADYKRDIEPSLKGVPEIGWGFASQAHGKGYASKVVRGVVA